MIKELLRQLKEHIVWFWDYPLQTPRIIRSFCMFLWKGYSEVDLWSVDYYLLKKFNEIIVDFAKDADNIGYPGDLTHETWQELLKNAKEWSDKILADEYSTTEDLIELENIKQKWLFFMYDRFFDLWT